MKKKSAAQSYQAWQRAALMDDAQRLRLRLESIKDPVEAIAARHRVPLAFVQALCGFPSDYVSSLRLKLES